MTLQTIIVSKDRPAQLELLLRSDVRFSPKRRVAVLWKTTYPDSCDGYEQLRKRYADVEWREEADFVEDMVAMVDPEIELSQFMVDDDVFIAPWTLNDPPTALLRNSPDVMGAAPRMAPHMDYCYTLNIITPPPVFLAGRQWLWPGLEGDWGYPNSVDGNIYRTADIWGRIQAREYRTPNQFEPALRLAMNRPLMVCWDRQVILNIPANSVQDAAWENRNGCDDPRAMTRRWLAGEQIALDPLVAGTYRSPHVGLSYTWEHR